MLNPLISGIVFGAEMLVIYIFYSRIAENELPIGKCLLIGLALFQCGSAINLLFQNNVMINTIATVGINLLFAVLCFDIRLSSGLFYSVLLAVVNFSLEIIAALLYAPYTQTNSLDVNTNPALLVLVVLSSKTLLLFLCLVLSTLIKPNTTRVKIPAILFVYPLALGLCLLIFWKICLLEEVTIEIQHSIALVCVIFFITTVILFIIYQHQIENNTLHIQLESELQRQQTERSYYEILEQQNENLMIYAHDAKKHLNAIKSLTTDPRISRYVDELSNQLKSYSKNCHSGNKLLDVIINKYAIDSESKGLSFYYDVRQCNLSEVLDIDLVAIVGNLMDNAVKAAENSEQKKISLETTCRNFYSVLIISNSCDSSPIIDGQHLVSSKINTSIHGFGVKSVIKTLKKYQGDLNWEYDDVAKIFTVTVMIGCNIEKSGSSTTLSKLTNPKLEQ